MKSCEKIVDVLIEAGIRYVFGLPGGGTMNIFDALYDHQNEITAVQARDEQAASCMACMYGRLTGMPGVFIAQGPFAGSTGVFGVMEAYLSSSPMLVLTDFSERHVFSLHAPVAAGTGAYGSFDLRNIFRATTKFTAVATTPIEAVQGTQLAIKHAISGRPGPTACTMHSPAILGPINPEGYPAIYPTAGYLRTTIPQLSPQDVQTTVDLLLEARKPVIIAGNGVKISRAYEELEKFAKILAAPVATSYLGKGAFAENHPLAVGPMSQGGQELALETVHEADVLIVIGCRLKPDDTHMELPEVINPKTQRIIQIDIDPRHAGWTFPIEMGLVGDAKAILRQLTEEISRRAGGKGRVDYQRVQEKLAQAKERSGYFEDPALYAAVEPIRPERVVKALREVTDPTAMIVGDGGNNRYWLMHYYQTRTTGAYFAPGGIGAVSWSLPAVFVAKLLHPERQCVAVCSDGGFAMQMNVLLTAKQYHVPAVFVVMNNSGFGMIRENLGERKICTDFLDTDYAEIARACGCLGFRVEKDSDLRPAMEAALKSGEPAVVDVVIEKEAQMFEKLFSPLAREARKRLRVRMLT
jgi:acetolactate synthase-1/2/3 large subunit